MARSGSINSIADALAAAHLNSYCCIYLACKTEEYSLPVDRMVAGILTAAAAAPVAATSAPPSSSAAPAPTLLPAVASTVSTVLSLEVPVLSVLQFHLRLHHLSRALRGLIKELETFDALAMSRALWINPQEPIQTQYTTAKGPGTEYMSLAGFFAQTSAGSRASVLLRHALLDDDLIFLHSPSQIALGVLATLEHEARSYAVEPKLDSTAHAAPTPLASLNLVARYIESLKPPKPNAAVAASKPNAAGGAATAASAPSTKQLQSKVDQIRQRIEEARVQSSQSMRGLGIASFTLHLRSSARCMAHLSHSCVCLCVLLCDVCAQCPSTKSC